MDIKQQTQNVAAQGRYGDNMLLHVNPAEVQGLASIMPLTKNPETGQPEAFLPFLAPLLGSMAGTALFTGLSAPVAGAIGSGIASAIQSGDLRQGIISGLTGFGLGKAFGAAGIGEAGRNAKALEDIVADVNIPKVLPAGAENLVTEFNPAGIDLSGAANVTSGVSSAVPEALTETLTRQAASTTPMLGDTAINLSGATSGVTDAATKGGFDAFASELAKPSSFIPVALGEGTTGTIQAQEDFEKAMRDYELEQQKRKEEIMAMYPEQIPMSSPFFYGKEGGEIPQYFLGRKILNTPEQQLENINKIRKTQNREPLTSVSSLPGKARIRPPREDRDGLRFPPPPIDRLQPPPPPPVGSFEAAMSGGLDAYYTPPKQLSGPVTAESVPVIDPMTGAPMIDPNTGMPVPSGQFKPSANYRPGIDPEFNYLPGGNRPASSLGNYLGQMGTGQMGTDAFSGYTFANPLFTQFGVISGGTPINERINRFNFNDMFRNYREPFNPLINREPINILEQPINIFEQEPMMDFPRNDFRTPPRFSVDRVNNDMRDIMPPVIPPTPLEDIGFGPGIRVTEDFFEPENIMMPPVMPPVMPSVIQDIPTNIPVENPFIQLPTPPMRDDFMSIERLPIRNNPPFMMEEGKQIPDDAKGLQALAKTEKGKEAVRQMGFELQMGGMAPSPDEIQRLQMAVLGQIPNNDEVISMFIDKYGNEMFMMIREQILNPTGNAQTQGMIEGMGGGMDDQVLGMIGSQQPVAVSPGEYIIPADVVSGLGDGSSDAGARELDGLLDRVRQERTNTTKQPKELNKGKVLPK